jgi:hypothetical protein
MMEGDCVHTSTLATAAPSNSIRTSLQSLASGIPSGARLQSVSELASTPAGMRNGQPSCEEIQRRAYEIYIARGMAHGGEMSDWLAAERQLREEMHDCNGWWSRRSQA